MSMRVAINSYHQPMEFPRPKYLNSLNVSYSRRVIWRQAFVECKVLNVPKRPIHKNCILNPLPDSGICFSAIHRGTGHHKISRRFSHLLAILARHARRDLVERFRLTRNRGTALSLCLYALSDEKPFRTFSGNALGECS